MRDIPGDAVGVAGDAPTRVLFFCTFPPPYTGQTIGTALTFELLKDSARVEKCDLSHVERHQGEGRTFSLGYLIHIAKRIRDVRRTLRTARYDVLYIVPASSVLGHLRDVVLMAFTRSQVDRVVAHVRTGDFSDALTRPWLRPLSRWFVRRVDRFIFLSDGLSARADGVIPAEQRSVVRNPIDRDLRFTEAEIAQKLDQRSRRRTLNVVFLSNMFPSKGYADVARALALLPPHLPWNATFAGAWPSADDRAAFEALLSDLGISDHTRIAGLLTDRREVRRLLRDADVFVLPTYYRAEAQPRSIIEALNAGTPVVVTRHASIPEYVFDEVNGYLVPMNAPQEIAHAIERLESVDRWREQAMGAREVYNRMFGPEVIAASLRRLVLGRSP
jgi:glycosyltransferase involved in cell wall biosynthesis